jgi:hypothetical protein
MRPKRRLSIIVDQGELGVPGPFDYRNLIDLIASANPLGDDTSFSGSQDLMVADIPVLVMLNEPTHESKKAVRGGIQDALRGTDSTRLLRTIVPVLEYDGASSEQLADDIVYAGDNYYGIGFWPLPFAGPADHIGMRATDTTSVNRLLALYFHPSEARGTGLGAYASAICPQRLWLRWIFWIGLLLAVAAGGFLFNCIGCNERLDNSSLYFGGTVLLILLPVVTLVVLALSDPVLEPFAPAVLLLCCALVVGGAVFVARHYYKKSRRKLP